LARGASHSKHIFDDDMSLLEDWINLFGVTGLQDSANCTTTRHLLIWAFRPASAESGGGGPIGVLGKICFVHFCGVDE